MVADSESILLQRFASQGDSGAFSQIVRQHLKMVYGVCVRILEDESDAADVTQETFFQLLRQARGVSGSVASWLHTVATRKSIDLIRRGQARRRREQAYAIDRVEKAETWHDLSPHVDQALEEMDEELRTTLLEHFFQGKTTTQIAEDRKISQATASRRINQGLDLLHASLRKQGMLATVAALGVLLTEATSQAVPVALANELTKMALVGSSVAAGATAGAGAQASSAAAGLLSGLGAKVATAVAVAAIGVGSVVTYNHVTQPAVNTPAQVSDSTYRSAGGPTSGRSAQGGPTVQYTQADVIEQSDVFESYAMADTSESFDEWFDRMLAESSAQDTVSDEPTGYAMGGMLAGTTTTTVVTDDSENPAQQQGFFYATAIAPQAADPNKLQEEKPSDDK